MIKTPHNYSEWVDVLNMLKNREDDRAVLSAMKCGTIEWQTGVAERFSQRLIDVINVRMNYASDKFQKEMSRINGNERGIIQAIIALRKELEFLVNAIDLPVIPDKDRSRYVQLVIEHADSVQKSLEDSAKTDRSGRLSSIVRNHRVNIIER